MADVRHEWKHEISRSDMAVIRQRLKNAAQMDVHGTDGRYEIRSLYFDNLADKALREKIDGVPKREKFRIRCYDRDLSLIRLEKKSKHNGLCRKESAVLSEEEVKAIRKGDISWMISDSRELLRELYCKMKIQGIRPRTIVDYTREAFVYAPGNVRVTLDYDIRTGLMGTDFLDPDCITIPAGDCPVILEVKWDAFLPDVIRAAVQLTGRRSSAFSKYAACRIYG